MDIVKFWEPADFNNARWMGVVFLSRGDDSPPVIGLYFGNIASGRKVFEGIIKHVGNIDENERIRLSIVEGEIEGQGPGYSVVIGPAPEMAMEDKSGERYVILLRRIRRMMTPPSGKSAMLEMFKENFKKHNEYFLIPVGGTIGEMKPHFDLAIKKHVIHFRQSSELVDVSDPDHGVLKKDLMKREPPASNSNYN